MTEAASISLESIPWERVDAKLRKKTVSGDRMTVTRYSFASGGRFPHHVHDQEQITFVLSGQITFRIAAVDHELAEGSLVVIPSDCPHSAEAGGSGAEVLSVVSPARTGGRGVSMLEEA